MKRHPNYEKNKTNAGVHKFSKNQDTTNNSTCRKIDRRQFPLWWPTKSSHHSAGLSYHGNL